jgi:hypothetical protein
MFAILLVAQMTVVSVAPRLSSEQAVRVLRASRSELDRTNAMPLEIPQRPRVVVIRSRPGDGPFGPLRLGPPSIVFNPPLVIPLGRSPFRRSAHVEHRYR